MSLCSPVPVFFLRRHILGASANQHAVLTTPLPTHFSTDSLSTSVVWGSPRAPCSLCWIPSLMIFWSSLQLVHYSVILWTSLSGLVYCIWVCRFFENKLTINCSTRLENDQIIMEKESLEIAAAGYLAWYVLWLLTVRTKFLCVSCQELQFMSLQLFSVFMAPFTPFFWQRNGINWANCEIWSMTFSDSKPKWTYNWHF